MSDLIDRRQAIDALKRISFSHWFECGEYLSEDTREIEIINSNKALEVIEALPSAQPDYQEVLGWLLAYHTKSFDLHGRYMAHEVIGWLVHDFANAYMAESRGK